MQRPFVRGHGGWEGRELCPVRGGAVNPWVTRNNHPPSRTIICNGVYHHPLAIRAVCPHRWRREQAGSGRGGGRVPPKKLSVLTKVLVVANVVGLFGDPEFSGNASISDAARSTAPEIVEIRKSFRWCIAWNESCHKCLTLRWCH